MTIINDIMARERNLKYLFALLGIFLLFFALRIPFLGKEYAVEEASWIRAGQGVQQTGFPWIYLGEQSPNAWANWHGPLFPWLLGGAFKLFGEHEVVARSIPLIFSFGQLILLYLLATAIFGKERGRPIGLLTAFLVAINPLAIQDAVQIDIDGGLVGFFTLLILYAAWQLFARNKPAARYWFLLAVGSILSFLTRFETALMAFFAVALFFGIKQGAKKGFAMAGFFIAMVAAAMVIYIGYGFAMHTFPLILQPFQSTVDVVLHAFGGKVAPSATTEIGPLRLVDLVGKTSFGPFTKIATIFLPSAAFLTVWTIWITLPLALLTILALTWLFISGAWKKTEWLFLLLPAVIMGLAFVVVAPAFNYPRYIHSAFIIFTLVAAAALWEWSAGKIRHLGAAIAAAAATLILVLVTPLRALLFSDRTRDNPIHAGIAFVAVALIGILCGIIFRKRPGALAWIGTMLAAMTIVFSSVVVIGDFSKPYSLNGYYGNYGFKAAGEYFKTIAKPGDALVMSDTDGYYYGGKYWDLNTYEAGLLPNLHPDYVAIYDVPPGRFDNAIQGMQLLTTIGTVEIYEKANATANATSTASSSVTTP